MTFIIIVPSIMDQSPLRKLAPELRNAIWESALQYEHICISLDTASDKPKLKYGCEGFTKTYGCQGINKIPNLTGLAKTCRALRDESLPLLYSLNKFVFEWDYKKGRDALELFFRQLSARCAKAVCHITLQQYIDLPLPDRLLRRKREIRLKCRDITPLLETVIPLDRKLIIDFDCYTNNWEVFWISTKRFVFEMHQAGVSCTRAVSDVEIYNADGDVDTDNQNRLALSALDDALDGMSEEWEASMTMDVERLFWLTEEEA